MSDFFATPWTVAHQALLSMGCTKQENGSVLPMSSPQVLPDPGIEPGSPALSQRSGSPGLSRWQILNHGATWEAQILDK